MANLLRQAALCGIIATASFAAASTYAACSPADINGSAMPAGSSADRTVAVTPTTKSVNVKYGETVKFVVQNGQETIWKFEGIANKLTLGTVMGAPSASEGSSAQMAAPGRNIPIYVDQGQSPMRSCN